MGILDHVAAVVSYNRKEITQRVCTTCKGSDFDQVDDGGFVCKDCGTQVRGIVEEQVQAGVGGTLGVGSGKRVQSATNVETAVAAMSEATPPSAAQIFEAFQCVLQQLMQSLAPVIGSGPNFAKSVGAIWQRVLHLFPEASEGFTGRITSAPHVHCTTCKVATGR